MPKERPILFSGSMVNAILANRKTQTRRAVKFNHKPWLEPLPHVEYARDGMPIWWSSPPSNEIRQSDYYDHGYPCPYGKPGDRLWVRETWTPDHAAFYPNFPIVYRADFGPEYERNEHGKVYSPEQKAWYPFRWRPSIHMPRHLSRITLEIIGVRVERLQEISAADAKSEGMPTHVAEHTFQKVFRDADEREAHRIDCYRDLWNDINGPGAWDRNEWVWVIEFKRIEGKAR